MSLFNIYVFTITDTQYHPGPSSSIMHVSTIYLSLHLECELTTVYCKACMDPEELISVHVCFNSNYWLYI